MDAEPNFPSPSQPTTARPPQAGWKNTVVRLIALTVLLGFFSVMWSEVQDARVTARRNSSSCHGMQIALAVHQYHSAHATLPAAASRDGSGKPLLSWRVAILPYMEEQKLLDQFNVNEPWDSPTNRRLIQKQPVGYISPQAGEQPSGETNFVAIVGPDTVITPKGVRLDSVKDGTSKTLMVVELAGTGITWSEPRDITIDEFIAALRRSPADAGLRPLYPGFVVSVCAAGTLNLIATDTPPDVVRALCTRNGGELVHFPN